MPDITFQLTLPDGPRSPFVVVAGGADGDHDGTIEDPDEVGAYKRADNVWTRTQHVDAPIGGTAFYVIFAVGQDVRWEFVVKAPDGSLLYRNQNTTVFHTGEIRWHLP